MTIKVAGVQQIRAIEAAADRSVMSYAEMMLRAGQAASAALQRLCPIRAASKIVFLIGKGNNGGDGLVMAYDLAQHTGAEIQLYLLEARSPADANFQAILDIGLPVTLAQQDPTGQTLSALLQNATIIVDALFGIGLRPPLRDPAAAVLDRIQAGLAQRAASRPFVFAIDCPSGVDCDSGAADQHTLAAAATITFIAAKPGFYLFPAAGLLGDLTVASLGLPPALAELRQISRTTLNHSLAKSLLPPRRLDGHKGTYGKVMLVAGSANYIGALTLAGEAAARSGAGLVTIATPQKLIDIAAGQLREPTWLPLPAVAGAIAEAAAETVAKGVAGYQALLIGCGLGLHKSTAAFLARLLRQKEALPPLLLDADALNILSRWPDWWQSLPRDSIITPHSGEMARLTGLPRSKIDADRWRVAEDYAAKWGLVVVLKGAHTVIAAPEGRASVIPVKTYALSTAGTGDILAGLIAGLRAQSLSAFDSARLGAYIHAQAGLHAAETNGSGRSAIAGDVLAALGQAFRSIESSESREQF